MLKSDFITKMIKKFKAALDIINKYKTEGKYNNALEEIDNILKELFRLNLKSFNTLSDDNVLELIKMNGSLEADKCIMISKLLQEEATIFELQGNPNESYYILLKSLNLYLEAYLANSSPELEGLYDEINNINKHVSQFELPIKLRTKIFKYYVESLEYAKAEDILYEILEDSHFNKEFVDMGLDFYNNISKKSNNDLESGGLTLDEVRDAIADLEKNMH